MSLKRRRFDAGLTFKILALALPVACLRPPEPPVAPKLATERPSAVEPSTVEPKLEVTTSKREGTQNVSVRVSIDAGTPIRTVKKAWFLGTNIAIWNQASTYTNPEVREHFVNAGIGLIRMPGGSASDQYFWNGNGVRSGDKVDRSKYKNGNWNIDYSKWTPGFLGFFGFPKDASTAEINSWQGNSNVKDQHEFIKYLRADTLVTVNAGTGTPRDAAEWVKWTKKQGYDVKFWEVGNELGGSWESGTVRADGKTMDGTIYGTLYRDFSKAIKAADPKALVGSQGGLDFIKGALAQKDAPIDFVTYHDYFSSDAPSPAALFQTLDKIKPAIAEVREAVQKLRPGKEILVGMTEFNSQLFEGSQTSDLNSGLWLTAALLEMMTGGLDFATQWDSFTQKPDKGGGHGFMIEQGAVPKAEYWTYPILETSFGDRLLKAESSDKSLRSYASRDSKGRLYAILVNTSQTNGYDVELAVSGANIAPDAQCMRFSEREYAWDPVAFSTPWNGGPSRLHLQINAPLKMMPASLLACELHGPPVSEGSLAVLGDTLAMARGTRTSVEVLAVSEGGPIAPKAIVRAEAKDGYTVEPQKATTDERGLARFVVTAPNSLKRGLLGFTSKGTPGARLWVTSVEPELVILGPEKAPTGQSSSMLAAVRYTYGSQHILLDSYSGEATLDTGNGHPSKLNIEHGLASFSVTSREAAKVGLKLKVADLTSKFDVEFFENKTSEQVVYRFDDASDLSKASGKAKFLVNPNVRPNQGVLEIPLVDTEGWTQDLFALDKINEAPKLDRAGIQSVSFDLGVGDNFDTGNSWAHLVVVLQSEANYWMPLNNVDLGAATKGQFKHITLPLKPEFQKAMKALFKVILVVNSGGKVNGSLYLDNLGFGVQTAK